MNKDRILELMARKLSGEATFEELRELQELVATDGEAGEKGKMLDQFWLRKEDEAHPSVEENLQKVLAGLRLPTREVAMEQAMRGKRRRMGGGWMRAAAVVLVLAAIGGFLFLRRGQHAEAVAMSSLTEKKNAKGTRSIIQLSDGSKIWLNADSKLKYPEVFRGDTREIYLNGEAFFDVAKNPGRPFIIHLANGTVQVLGTSFNIRAYDNERVVETSVASGRIAFIPRYKTLQKKQDTVYLSTDLKASYSYSSEELSTSVTSAKEDRAWTDGKLVFHGMFLGDIATELERNFGKKVVFADEAPKTYVFTGSFENNSLEEILYYLSRTKHFSFKITNSELLIAADADRLP